MVCQEALVKIRDIVHVIALDVVENFEQVHVSWRPDAPMVMPVSFLLIFTTSLHRVAALRATVIKPIVRGRCGVLAMPAAPS